MHTLTHQELLEAIKNSAIGHDINEVKQEASRTGWSIRIMKQDGKNCMGTCDYIPSRINVEVKDDKVVEVFGIG